MEEGLVRQVLTEADTCRIYVLPGLYLAGWADEQIREQLTFTPGRIIVSGGKVRRGRPKRVDYLLSYRPNLPIAVVEAKPSDALPGAGMQQALEYAQLLDLSFAYSTNGLRTIEHDFSTGTETEIPGFPSPGELWGRHCAYKRIRPDDPLITAPYNTDSSESPRYYQDISIHRATEAIARGQRRVLLTLATGTGKTLVAFQLAWRLWSTGWNRRGTHAKPRILFLADRNVLVDDPKERAFAPFGDARTKIENGKVTLGREMYFSTYQSLAHDEQHPALYRKFPRDFFDLIIIDECHRGSAHDESAWREILDYFEPAVQLGMTATPLRQENRDTYEYFGNPLYTYSLKSGIDDGFLAPYRVHRVVTSVDATGWRPAKGSLDRYGREIPDRLYETQDFERALALRSRTLAIARHLTAFLEQHDPFAKTIVFCVDQEHADEMRRELNNLSAERSRQYPDYVCRVTADEGDVGLGHLSRFQELETVSPVILTTSQLLTTGVDAPLCKNVVLARTVNSLVEFKQIIGRGTRVREDYGKLFFNILDYTGSATRLFADPEFDGEPARVTEQSVDSEGRVVTSVTQESLSEQAHSEVTIFEFREDRAPEPRKYYYDGGRVEIAAQVVYEIGEDGRQLQVVSYREYTRSKVRALYPSAEALISDWRSPAGRRGLIQALADRGIDLARLRELVAAPDADPIDLLCHLAFAGPIRSRAERATRVAREHASFFERYGPDARVILHELLEKYAAHGPEQLTLPDALKVAPLSTHGNPTEIAQVFGGAEKLRTAVDELHALLYAA